MFYTEGVSEEKRRNNQPSSVDCRGWAWTQAWQVLQRTTQLAGSVIEPPLVLVSFSWTTSFRPPHLWQLESAKRDLTNGIRWVR